MGHCGNIGGFSHKGGVRFNSLVHLANQAMGSWVSNKGQARLVSEST